MATVVHEHHVEVPSFEGLRISWGGIWGGVLVVMGTLLLLTTLGLAIGITAADPQDTQASTVGTAAAIWTSVSLLLALFIGGMAATRLGMVFDKAAGAFEGALVWVLSFLVILWLAGSGVSLIAGGVSSLFGGVTKTVGSVVSGNMDLSQGDTQQILSRLRDPQTAQTIASATGMSEQEVSSTLNDIAQRAEAAKDDPARVAAEVRQGTQQLMAQARARLPAVAEQAKEGATKTAWITFAAMALSLLAAIGGAMLGRRRVMDRLAHVETAALR